MPAECHCCLQLQIYNGKLQLVAKIQKPASFLLLDGRSGVSALCTL